MDRFFLPCFAYDSVTRHRIHPAYFVALVLIILVQVAHVKVVTWEPWINSSLAMQRLVPPLRMRWRRRSTGVTARALKSPQRVLTGRVGHRIEAVLGTRQLVGNRDGLEIESNVFCYLSLRAASARRLRRNDDFGHQDDPEQLRGRSPRSRRIDPERSA